MYLFNCVMSIEVLFIFNFVQFDKYIYLSAINESYGANITINL